MRILYIDIDTLRPDHLGCYGYHRPTSPNIDALANDGIRFDAVYASDTPCLPSRSALVTGRFGIHNGVVGHGGTAADLRLEGYGRGFQSLAAITSWPRRLRFAGLRTASISTFAERHSAYHWNAGFNEVFNIGKMGMERAEEVTPLALDWLGRNGAADGWFLHVHFWDPHTPYRTPADFGDPFAGDDLPAWLTEDVRAAHWELPGPHSPQEAMGHTAGTLVEGIRRMGQLWGGNPPGYEDMVARRQPEQIASMDDVRRMFDGYDTGVRYADHHVGILLNELDRLGVLDETVVMVSGDHGETLGELALYCDHATADLYTSRLPMILRWPGLGDGRVDGARHYQIDVAATILDLLGVRVPANWDGVSFAEALKRGEEDGRSAIVTTHGAHTVQRGVSFEGWWLVRTWHDGWHPYPEHMLFDLEADPHEQEDLAEKYPEVVAQGLEILAGWHSEQMATASGPDPIETILAEGGPWHFRGLEKDYWQRLRDTGRGQWAQVLAERHGLSLA